MLVYLVDASHSVSARALDTAAQAIERSNAGVQPDAWRILAFGGGVAAIADTAALRRLATAEGADPLERLILPQVTNLEQALAAARAEIPPSSNGRIVLFSDGRQTDGDSLRSAERLAAERVPVFTQPMPVRDIGDTWIEEVRVAHAPAADSVTRIEVVVGSQVARRRRRHDTGRARACLRGSARPGARPVDRARRRVVHGRGPHLVEAVVTAARDVLPDNNTLPREIGVEPRPRVLYVHAALDDAGARRSHWRAPASRSPWRSPRRCRTSRSARRWDVVVLSNVARSALSPQAMAALGSWVEERGGGLLFVGGSAVFGEGVEGAQPGYRHTEIERVLPVTFDRDDEPEVALVIVLDRSWSMNGTAMELSKTAAEAAANTLAPSQMLGVLTFNDTSNWDVPLGRVRDSRAAVHDAIAGIKASGPTAIYPALGEAYARSPASAPAPSTSSCCRTGSPTHRTSRAW